MEKQQLRVACEHAAAQRDVPRVAREAGVTPPQIYALIARGNFASKYETQLRDALVRLGYMKGSVTAALAKRPDTVIGMTAADLEALAAMLIDKRMPLTLRLQRFETLVQYYASNMSSVIDAMRLSETEGEE
jgi:hypothetical protein